MLNMHQRLQSDMKDAMRARDQLRVDTLRMAMNAIKSSFDNQKKQAYDAAGGESNMAASTAAVAAVALSLAGGIAIQGHRQHQVEQNT